MLSTLFDDNRMFTLARRAVRLPHLLVAVVMTLLFVLVAPIIALPVFLILPSPSPSPVLGALRFTLLLVASFAPAALALWLWLRFFERRPFWTLGLERWGALAKYGRGLLIGVGMFGVAVALAALLGYIAPEAGDPQQQGFAALGGVLLVYVGWTIQGPVEEIVTRGWLMSVIGARYRPWVGVVVSSAVFAALHSLNPNFSLLALVNLCLFGLFAALYTLWEGGIWGICALHAGWNWVQGNIFGLEVSGQAVAGGILYNLRETGPDLVTGGLFGPEAGLIVTMVLLIGIGLLGAVLWRREHAHRRSRESFIGSPE